MIKVGILGAAGYTGGELIRLLLNHPEAEIVFANSESNAGNLLSDVHEGLLGETQQRFTDEMPFDKVDVVFQQIEVGGRQQTKLDAGGKTARVSHMLGFLDVFLVDLRQTIHVVVVAFDAEILCQVDDFYMSRDAVLFEESLALTMAEAEEYNVNLVEGHLVSKLQIGIANQTFMHI